MQGFKSNVARFRFPLVLLLVGLLSAISIGYLSLPAADLNGNPRAQDRAVTRSVAELLREVHLSRRRLDDEISQRGFDTFLKSLDPLKMYFTQADIDEFTTHATKLDDDVAAGDIKFGYQVFQRFLQRVDQRLATIQELLAGDFDFTVDEELATDPKSVTYPRSDEEARDRWRKRLKYDLLVLKGDKTEGDEARDRLRRRYSSFAKRMHQTDGDELLEMYLTSVTSSYDPHTTYMSPSSLDNFDIQMRLELDGIGAALQVTDGYTVVSKIIPGGAADKHGKLKVEDRIVSVGEGKDGGMVDVVDMKLGDVVKLIRGKAGSIVRLGVIPSGGTETQEYEIVRAKIELTDSEAHGEVIEDERLRKADGTPYRVGYIDLPSFYMDMEGARRSLPDYKSTTRDVRKILEDFKTKGVDAVVLDLRRNGGGSLTEAIHLTGLFIDKGPVVQVKDDKKQVDFYQDLDEGMAWDGPLVVMTSKFSASASEILAGAIQDYHRGIIVGDESTHGKGTVQTLMDLGTRLFRPQGAPNMGALKITMSQFYRPNGDSTQKRGVLADIVLPSLTNHMDVSESDLDYALEFDQVPAVSYDKYNMVDEALLNKLRSSSLERRRGSTDFAKLLQNIDRYVEQKERKSVNLKEETFFARRAELNAEEEDEKQIDEQINRDGKGVKRDFYFNEVMAITVDYLQQLRDNKVARAR
ncbi:MAG: carboxy terminal-processing peptidase [Pirellulaceae bacterium]|nr:carboxy terminal-processing peptidase [Pirellulaceae bacterium]